MAAPTMRQIREALADALDGIPDVQVSPWLLANPTPPSINIFPAEVMYDGAMGRGMDTDRLTVQAFTGLVESQSAQITLDRLLDKTGTYSVKAAIEADDTLGGIVNSLRVVTCTGYKVYSLPGRPGSVIGCEWVVEIITDGE